MKKVGPVTMVPKVKSMTANFKGSARGLFPRVPPPKRLKPLQTRIYSKNVSGEDPSKFMGNSGFGDTGMSGES